MKGNDQPLVRLFEFVAQDIYAKKAPTTSTLYVLQVLILSLSTFLTGGLVRGERRQVPTTAMLSRSVGEKATKATDHHLTRTQTLVDPKPEYPSTRFHFRCYYN